MLKNTRYYKILVTATCMCVMSTYKTYSQYLKCISLACPPDIKGPKVFQVLEEIKTAINLLKNNKSPGIDGLISEYTNHLLMNWLLSYLKSL